MGLFGVIRSKAYLNERLEDERSRCQFRFLISKQKHGNVESVFKEKFQNDSFFLFVDRMKMY